VLQSLYITWRAREKWKIKKNVVDLKTITLLCNIILLSVDTKFLFRWRWRIIGFVVARAALLSVLVQVFIILLKSFYHLPFSRWLHWCLWAVKTPFTRVNCFSYPRFLSFFCLFINSVPTQYNFIQIILILLCLCMVKGLHRFFFKRV